MRYIIERASLILKQVRAPTRRGIVLLPVVLGLIALSACNLDLQSPAIFTYDDADPHLLVNGAIESWMWGFDHGVISEWVASDEANAHVSTTWIRLDQTGSLHFDEGYQRHVLREFMAAREATRTAIQRAEEEIESAPDFEAEEVAITALRRAKAYRGWFVTGLARRWGDQPIVPKGEVLSQAQQYEYALRQFSEVIESAEEDADSLRLDALAGTARLQWMLGSDPADPVRLSAAIAAAEEVLALEPAYFWALDWAQSSMPEMYLMWGDLSVSPRFEDIPLPDHNPEVPAGDMFINADGLWLIIAGAHLRMGELDLAKAALASTPLIKVNHTGLAGRDPWGAPLTDAEVNTFVGSLDEGGVQFTIDELYREAFYLRGRRNVSQAGNPIWPVPLPPYAY